MLKIGLTGGIGSGKTTVAKLFALLEVPVYYADLASKELYHTNPGLIASIKEQFGEDVYPDNRFDRVRMSQIVFADAAKLEQLNALVHPLTIEDARAWMERQTAPYLVKEAALLFESGSSSDLDLVIGVSSPEDLRLRRVINRDGLSEEEVRQRMNRQMNEEEKMKRCDFVITNNEEQLIIPQVLALHARFLKIADAMIGG